jgi:hypothetical protein
VSLFSAFQPSFYVRRAALGKLFSRIAHSSERRFSSASGGLFVKNKNGSHQFMIFSVLPLLSKPLHKSKQIKRCTSLVAISTGCFFCAAEFDQYGRCSNFF